MPNILEWLKQELPADATVGIDPRLIPAETYKKYEKVLNGQYF